MADLHAGRDLYDITGQVTAVTAVSPLLGGTAAPGFTNGKSYYFTDDQIDQLSHLLADGQLRRRPGAGWEEVVPGEGLRYLAERHQRHHLLPAPRALAVRHRHQLTAEPGTSFTGALPR